MQLKNITPPTKATFAQEIQTLTFAYYWRTNKLINQKYQKLLLCPMLQLGQITNSILLKSIQEEIIDESIEKFPLFRENPIINEAYKFKFYGLIL